MAKSNGKGKQTRAEDIPPDTPQNLSKEVKILRELQRRYYCAIHSSSAIKSFCWIELAGIRVKGGHREMSHGEMTLWAQYIVSQSSGCDEGGKTYRNLRVVT